jgi:hypothetical protein
MGDSPFPDISSTNSPPIVDSTVIILFTLRVLGWLVFPIVIGAFLEQTQKDLVRRETELFNREQLLLQGREESAKKYRDILREGGQSEEDINKRTEDMFKGIDEAIAKSKNSFSKRKEV